MTQWCQYVRVWSLWHFQTTSDARLVVDDDLPHLLIGYFNRRDQAEEVRNRLLRQPGLRDWRLGFRLGCETPDIDGAWETGFFREGEEDDPAVDGPDMPPLPEPTPTAVLHEVWSVWHFQVRDATAPPEPHSAKQIGLFTSLANAIGGAAHRRQQRGFRDWPEGFRFWKRRLGVAFGLDGFQERYGWDAWERSLRG